MSHHIHNILLFRVKFGLEVEGLGFPGSQYALFLTMLLDYVIHWSGLCIPLFIPSYHSVQKGLDFVPSKQRCAIWQLDHPNFSDLIHVASILNTFTPILSSEYGQKWFVELSLSAISDVVRKKSCSNIALTTSLSIKDGRPERGLSERSKSPVSNFSYHLLHVLSETVPSPNTFNKFLHSSLLKFV